MIFIWILLPISKLLNSRFFDSVHHRVQSVLKERCRNTLSLFHILRVLCILKKHWMLHQKLPQFSFLRMLGKGLGSFNHGIFCRASWWKNQHGSKCSWYSYYFRKLIGFVKRIEILSNREWSRVCISKLFDPNRVS